MIERTVSKRVSMIGKSFKILFVSGARQVGKTTLLKVLSNEKMGYVTLDRKSDLEIAETDPAGFFSMHSSPCIIDEVQRAPGLFLEMKRVVDEEDKAGQFWITGSQKPKLKKNVGDTLAGRVAEVALYPLSQAEKQNDPYRPSFIPSFDGIVKAPWGYRETLENVVIGGYPALQELDRSLYNTWFSSYINAYLLGDIRSEFGEIDEMVFTTVLKVLAARTATMMNINAISQDTGLSYNKTSELIHLLESCGIIFRVPPYLGNTLKRIVKTPRFYFSDSGLCCHLLGIDDVETLLSHPLKGAIFESYAVSEIIRNSVNNGENAAFSFYREETKGQSAGPAEIDLVKEVKGCIYPIEIKLNTSPSISAAKHFSRLTGRVGMGTVISLSPEKRLLSKDVLLMPVSMI